MKIMNKQYILVDDIAKYIIHFYTKENAYVSALSIHKILYMLQVFYYVQFKELLFTTQFEAWPYGPVIRCVYYKYQDNGSYPLTLNEDIQLNLSQDKQEFIDMCLFYLKDKSPWFFTAFSQREESPWRIIYNASIEDNYQFYGIPNDMIIQDVETFIAHWSKIIK